ncbi:HAD family hydrolase [Chloroflexota bacterium]
MKYKAVIFDLGGTLVHTSNWSDYANAARKMASILSAPIEYFTKLWMEQSVGLGTGHFQSYHDYIRHICSQLQLIPHDTQVQEAANMPFEMTKRMLTSHHEGGIELLTFLKTNGCKTGLITDCATDIPTLWDDTLFAPLFDVAIFSCYEGMNKEDIRIFELAGNKLGVKPNMCLYIADGMRQELENASKIGMSALKIQTTAETGYNPWSERWDGPVISSLSEVMEFLE